MRYEQPYGVADEGAPYVNENRALDVLGSIPSAQALENPQRELVNLIRQSGLQPSALDLQQVLKSARSQAVNFSHDTGTINQLTVSYIPPIDVYTIGLPLRVRVAHANAGAASLDAGAGRHHIKRPDGSDLQRGDLTAGQIATFMWDGVNFQLISGINITSPEEPKTQIAKIPYTEDTSPIANNVVAPFDPEITSVIAGDIVAVKLANTVTGEEPVLISVNALPPTGIRDRWGANLSKWAAVAGEIMLLIFHPAGYWQLVGAKNPYESVWVFDKAGQFLWRCPENVHEIEADIWGSGASGANRLINSHATYGACGGPSGGYAWGIYPVEPGRDYSITVGAGGPATYGHQSCSSGNTSSFDTLIAATGGQWIWVPYSSVGGVLTRIDPEYAHMPAYQINPGRGIGGQINLFGGQPWLQMGQDYLGDLTGSGIPPGVDNNIGMAGWWADYGYGAAAPRGGMVTQAYILGKWPGGGGGGGDYDPAIPGTLAPGAGADGGLIIIARG